LVNGIVVIPILFSDKYNIQGALDILVKAQVGNNGDITSLESKSAKGSYMLIAKEN
jgi:hypothetical protein